nr:aminoglycoside phosphotransferase family protein [Micromonospora acroterricola]
MSPTPLPPVPYHASALRPSWPALPAALRDAIADRLGAPVVTARVAGAGFTRGFAAVLSTADGDRAFVKAAPAAEQPHLVDAYAREAAILDRLPAGLPAPRPRWTLYEAGWFVLCTDAVDGHTPRLPWGEAELDATLAGYAEVAAALADPPAGLTALGLPHLADLARSDILWWEEVAAGREPAPALPEPVRGRLPELVALESRLPRYAAGVADLTHGDLRVDNVLIDGDGRAWFCDWTWVCHGPAWFDLAGLLLTAYAGGLDADRLFATHPVTAGAPPDALDATLAALAGYFLTGATTAPVTASPHLPAHQRWSGEQALDWLTNRQGWR